MPPTDSGSNLAATVRAMADRIADSDYGTGPLAELRRLDPRHPVAPAFYRLLARLPDGRPYGLGIEEWALLIHAIALAAPELHLGKERLGKPLFAAGYKEGRLTRLLNARAEDLPKIIPRMVRFLVAKGEALDPVVLAWFIHDVSAGGERAEKARERLARDYYRAEADTEKTADSRSKS